MYPPEIIKQGSLSDVHQAYFFVQPYHFYTIWPANQMCASFLYHLAGLHNPRQRTSPSHKQLRTSTVSLHLLFKHVHETIYTTKYHPTNQTKVQRLAILGCICLCSTIIAVRCLTEDGHAQGFASCHPRLHLPLWYCHRSS